MAVEKGGEEKCIAISFDEIHYLVQVAFRWRMAWKWRESNVSIKTIYIILHEKSLEIKIYENKPSQIWGKFEKIWIILLIVDAFGVF